MIHISQKFSLLLNGEVSKWLYSSVHPTRRTTGAVGEEQGQGEEVVRQQHGPQRQVVVRRFQLAFQLDVALLLKLAFAVVLFGQEGSRQRTIVLVLLASLVYL